MMAEIKDPQRRMKEKLQTPLHIAAEDGMTNEVIRLLKAGAIVDAPDRWRRTPLHLAVEWGYLGIVNELMAAGANVHAQTIAGETPLFFALRYDCENWDNDDPEGVWLAMARTLLAAGAKFKLANLGGLRPIHLAAGAKYSSPEILEFMIRGGADVNVTKEFGDTPLHCAANNGKTESVRLLIAAGADVHARGAGDCTPLHSATGYYKTPAELVRLLIAAKADVNAKDDDGETPLHGMCPIGGLGWVTELLNAGANPNAKSDDGRTPLHQAAKWGRGDIAKLLLAAGAEISAIDNEGQTPLDMTADPYPLAEKKNLKACVALLKKAGATNGTDVKAH